MIPAHMVRDVVVRLRAVVAVDEYGNGSVRDWSDPDRLVVVDCSLQPVDTSEYVLDRDATVSRWRLFLQPDVDVASDDRIEAFGSVFEVDGSVQDWRDPAGIMDHRVCLLVERRG